MKARLGLTLLLLSLALASCGKSSGPLDKIAVKASAPTGNRSVISQDIMSGVRSKIFGVGDAIDLAHKMLESAAAGSTGSSPHQTASLAATAFAGGVLDAIAGLADTLPKGGEHEIFWMQVGRLAFRAGEEAFANERLAESRSLILGGGKRWQNEPYWLRYTDHDGLASAIMAAGGDRSGAIERLQSRSDLSGVALEVYQELTGR